MKNNQNTWKSENFGQFLTHKKPREAPQSKKMVFLMVILTSILCVNLVSADWWDDDWTYRKEVNITGGESVLTNFPVLINVSFSTDMSIAFYDIRFINGTCSGTQTDILSYEFDAVINSTQALVWVKIPSLQTGTNQICMYYGRSGESSGENKSDTWDSSYKGVYHFTEGTGTHIIDSTGNGNGTLSASGVTWNTTRYIGNSLIFDGAADTSYFRSIWKS